MSEREELLLELLKRERVLSEFMSSMLHSILEVSATYAKNAPKMIDDIVDKMREIDSKYPEIEVEYDKDESS